MVSPYIADKAENYFFATQKSMKKASYLSIIARPYNISANINSLTYLRNGILKHYMAQNNCNLPVSKKIMQQVSI